MTWIVAEPRNGSFVLHELAVDPDAAGSPVPGQAPTSSVEVSAEGIVEAIRARETSRPRWVFDDVATRYPSLLAAGLRLERCHDLRLSHAILRRSATCAESELATSPPDAWDEAAPAHVVTATPEQQDTLFDLDRSAPQTLRSRGEPISPLAELDRQLRAVAGSASPNRLRLLLAAESTGALIAAEIAHDGLPWDVTEHDRLLTEVLGPRPAPGRRPDRLETLAGQIREALDAPGLNPDSQPDLLRALRGAGLPVTSTRKHEIVAQQHPVVEPLLVYKSLSRLLSANGWAWMDTWVHDGRFRPDYVVGGVVTGRWATSGGGALQLPAIVRSAVRADPGWRFVVADAAQLEPRVLAAMSADRAMIEAARGADLYRGLVDAGVVADRHEAKVGMLGAIYGGTTGVSAAVLPKLQAAFGDATALVDRAARAGERGDVVSTWLGRSSPRPGSGWWAARDAAAGESADRAAVAEFRRRSRDWGRFTRNFVVQGTAAEWALCWMAAIRRRLRDAPGAHLVFFLHDEVIVHVPQEIAEEVAEEVRQAAAEAGRLLFGANSVEFPLDVAVVDSYDQAD